MSLGQRFSICLIFWLSLIVTYLLKGTVIFTGTHFWLELVYLHFEYYVSWIVKVSLQNSLHFFARTWRASWILDPIDIVFLALTSINMTSFPHTVSDNDFQFLVGKFSLLNHKLKAIQSCLTLCNPMDYTVHGILQARILEWGAFSFSRGSHQPRDRTQVSCTAGRFFISWATRGAQGYWSGVAYPFSRRSSQPRTWVGIFCIASGFFTSWSTR